MYAPQKTNGWNLKISTWKRRNIYKPTIFINFLGSMLVFWGYISQVEVCQISTIKHIDEA